MSIPFEVEMRFWSKVKKAGENDCWEWAGTMLDSTKYARGVFSINGKNIKAHRVIYQIFYGDIPEGKFICHTCDNMKCVNPKHLFLGDALSNNKDCYAKGRHPILRGDDDPKSKLRGFQVLEIVELYKSGKYSQTDLAHKYGVSRGAVLSILRGDNWQHLTHITKPLNLFSAGYRPELERSQSWHALLE